MFPTKINRSISTNLQGNRVGPLQDSSENPTLNCQRSVDSLGHQELGGHLWKSQPCYLNTQQQQLVMLGRRCNFQLLRSSLSLFWEHQCNVHPASQGSYPRFRKPQDPRWPQIPLAKTPVILLPKAGFQSQTKICAIATPTPLSFYDLLSANTILSSSDKKEFMASQAAETSLTCVL